MSLLLAQVVMLSTHPCSVHLVLPHADGSMADLVWVVVWFFNRHMHVREAKDKAGFFERPTALSPL